MGRILVCLVAAAMFCGILPAAAIAASAVPKADEAHQPDYGVALSGRCAEADFWCSAAGERLLGTAEDVAALNERLREAEPSLTRLEDLPRAVSRAGLRRWMEEAAPQREAWYAPEKPLADAAYAAVVENCGMEELPLRNTIRYGVAVRRADLRLLPTEDAWLDTPGDVCYDSLQATAVDPAEPLAVWAKSRDGRFFFVSMRYYRGWLAQEDVALCSREAWLSYVNPADFLVVTANRYEAPEAAGGQIYQLGSRIPLAKRGGVLLARLPQRTTDGRLEELFLPLPYCEGEARDRKGAGEAQDAGRAAADPASLPLHRGFLPYTANNVLRAAFACLGDVYGWGGQDGSVDCSSFVADAYRTVGIELPRDADRQEAAFFGAASDMEPDGRNRAVLPCAVDLENLSSKARTRELLAAPPASLLFRSGHVMLLLGEDEGRPYIIHSLSGCWEKTPAGIVRRRIRRVLVSDAYFLTGSGGTNLDACTSIGSFVSGEGK